MRLIGYKDAGTVMVARVSGPGAVQPIAPTEEFWNDPFRWERENTADGRDCALLAVDALEVVPPVRAAARVICVGLNYADHAAEGNWDPPRYPTVFGRWTSSLAVSGAPVAVPVGEPGLDWEAELAVIIGRPLFRAAEADTEGAIFGYAPFNDLTARTLQKLTSQWTLGKNADGSGPLGPIVTAAEVGPVGKGLTIECRVNGETVQSASTAAMIFPIGYLLAFLSQGMTLHPGDVVATGTPSGVGYVRTPPRFLVPGDTVEVEIERVGSVSTPVIAT